MNPSVQPPATPFDECASGGAEQRTQPDRRSEPTSPWGAFPPAGRRLKNRRACEHRRPYFVDRFSAVAFALVILLLTVSIVDALLTIHLIGAGGDELNPLMDRLLDHGVLPFLLVKYLLTASGLPVLLIFKNHYLFGTRVRVGYLLPAAIAMYVVLIGYQLVLVQECCPA